MEKVVSTPAQDAPLSAQDGELLVLAPHKSLQVRLIFGFVVIASVMILAVVLVLQLQLSSRLEQQQMALVSAQGTHLVDELKRRAALVNALTQSIAAAVAMAPSDEALVRRMLPQMLSLPAAQSLVAGGGYWPEPFAFDATKERRSFFWGRGKDGSFTYFDDYNAPAGPGYHREEWYVPARYQQPGRCYWSRSYIDPYSGEPMVTCSVGIFREARFIGVATVDIRLEGLSVFFARQAGELGGYAFAVDQHNRFISYPNLERITHKLPDDAMEYLDAAALAAQDDRFQPVADILQRLSQQHLAQANDPRMRAQLEEKLVQGSYQIGVMDAPTIAMALQDADQSRTASLLYTTILNSDLVLNEPVNLSVFHVPGAYWKVVVVTPTRQVFASVRTIVTELLRNLLLPLGAALLAAFFLLRWQLIHPVRQMTLQLRNGAGGGGQGVVLLNEDRQDELGQLAYWYNQRAAQIRVLMDKLSRSNTELAFQASRDSLTTLHNRRAFDQLLDELVGSDQWSRSALIYLDIDQFKVVNDTCGHLAGDELLKQIAQEMRQVMRQTDYLARLGGDEFAILMIGVDVPGAVQFAERLRRSVENIRFLWLGRTHLVSASLGVVHLDSVPPDKTMALSYVDSACYVAKDCGRNRVQLHADDDAMLNRRQGEMQWMPRIRAALENDQFAVEFQLIAPLNASGRIGMEALIRLQDDNGKLIPPGAFLPAAERYGASDAIDRWMIEHVMQQLAGLGAGLDQVAFCSINLSAASFAQEQTGACIARAIQRYGIAPDKLLFEVTESAAIENLDSARSLLTRLRAMGCKVALDDFGAGMSSYAYLQALPVDILKIDGRFVVDMDTNPVHFAFVRSIHDIARVMGLRTIAEFVETDAVADCLRDIGVHYGQGWGIARPCALVSAMQQLSDGDEVCARLVACDSG